MLVTYSLCFINCGVIVTLGKNDRDLIYVTKIILPGKQPVYDF